MEIREDNFSMKFNLNHLNETTGKIYKGCSDISGEFKDLHMKNSIDMRASCQAIDIGFQVMVDIVENSKSNLDDNFRHTSDRLKGVVANMEKCLSLERMLIGDIGENDDDLQNLPDYDEFALTKTTIWNTIKDITKIEDKDKKLGILAKIETEEIQVFIKNNSKKGKGLKDEMLTDKLVRNKGPWQERVEKVKSELNEFDRLKEESQRSIIKVDEAKAEMLIKEQEVETMKKVKKTLEDRVIDLEMKNNNLSYVEKEKKRLAEKERHLVEMCDSYRKEIEQYKEKIEKGEIRTGKSPVRKRTEGNEANEEQNPTNKTTAIKLNTLKRMNWTKGSSKGSGYTGKKNREEYNFKEKYEVYGMMSMISKMSEEYRESQAGKVKDTFEDWKSKMPVFCKNYLCLNGDNWMGGEFYTDLGRNMTELNKIESRLKNHMLERRVVDLKAIKSTGAVARVQEMESAIDKQDRTRDKCKYEAQKLMSDIYKNYLDKNGLPMNTVDIEGLTKKAVESCEKKKIGVVKFLDLNKSDKIEGAGGTGIGFEKVGIRAQKLQLVQAIKL